MLDTLRARLVEGRMVLELVREDRVTFACEIDPRHALRVSDDLLRAAAHAARDGKLG